MAAYAIEEILLALVTQPPTAGHLGFYFVTVGNNNKDIASIYIFVPILNISFDPQKQSSQVIVSHVHFLPRGMLTALCLVFTSVRDIGG